MCVWVVGGVESSEAFFQGLGPMSSSSHQLKRMSLSHLPWNRSGAHTLAPAPPSQEEMRKGDNTKHTGIKP